MRYQEPRDIKSELDSITHGEKIYDWVNKIVNDLPQEPKRAYKDVCKDLGQSIYYYDLFKTKLTQTRKYEGGIYYDLDAIVNSLYWKIQDLKMELYAFPDKN